MKNRWKFILYLLSIVCLLGVSYFYLKKILLNQMVKWIEENPLTIPLNYTIIQKDTCGLGICLKIPNAHLILLNQDIALGDIEIGLLFQYPLTLHLSNQKNKKEGNYLTTSMDISQNQVQIHHMDFHLFPLQGTLNGHITQTEGTLDGHIQNLRSFLQHYWLELNPNLPVALTYFISDTDQPIQLTRRQNWILINQIPLFSIK